MTVSPQVESKAWRWAIGWSVAVLGLSCLPYFIAIFLAPKGWHFAGILVNPYDAHSYLAKMRQGFAGSWLLHLTHTPEPHEGVFMVYIFYLALGHLARLAHLPLIVVFHLARLVAGLMLLLAAFRFVTLVTSHPQERRLAFILLSSASGLGWLGVIFNAFPIDLWIPEAFVPYSLYTNPHFPLGLALMLLVLQLVVWPPVVWPPSAQAQTKPDGQNPVLSTLFYLLLAGLAALALALVFPFAALITWAILAVYLAWLYASHRRLPWPQIWPALVVMLGSLPVIVYDYWVSTTHPILAGWGAQNVTPAPAIGDLVLGFGVIGILAIVGGWVIIRQERWNVSSGEWLILGWAVTSLVLVYLPFFDLQRRLIAGLQIPLCLLAAIGLTRWLSRSSLASRYRRLITNAVIILGILGTVFVWSLPLLGLLQPPAESETSALFFLGEQEVLVFNWLRENTNANDVVLASPRLGMFVPDQTGARSFYGHPFETINADKKRTITEAFYRGEIDLETVSPLPDFVIYGPSERALGQPQNLAAYPVVFSTKDITVYGTK
ncbi:MAG: hypothetical protein JXM69_14605 [Anaerolineae bacterium]|nr:hypothetical protein [Anaerolineae bacterium]